MAKISLAEQVALIEDFLSENFAFRNNEVRDTIEFKVLNPQMGGALTNTEFMPVNDKALNSIILEAMKTGIEGKVTDLVKRVIYSMATESFNPLQAYCKFRSLGTAHFGVTVPLISVVGFFISL